MLSFTDKVAIITGASSGIGLATAQLLLEQGAFVHGVDVSAGPPSLLDNEKFSFQQIDLRTEGSTDAVVQECQKHFGQRIDILLNVAGVMDNCSSVDTMDPAMWERVIAINLTAPAMLSKAVVNVFKTQESGGCIVNVSSKAGMSGAAAGAAYTASKHGLVGLTKNIAWRFHEEGIRCNAICPGGFATGITSSIDMSTMDMNAMKYFGPVQALNTTKESGASDPKNAASVLAFLASDAAKEINGAIIPVDKGWSTI